MLLFKEAGFPAQKVKLKRPASTLEEKPGGIQKFVVLSCCLHVLAFTAQGMIPAQENIPPSPPPIQVKFVEMQKPEPSPKNPGTIVDAPTPETLEKPNTLDLLSNADSRMHANLDAHKDEEYRNNKTAVPKPAGTRELEDVPPAPAREKPVVQKVKAPIQKKKEPRPINDKGITMTETAPEPPVRVAKVESARNPGAGNSALALLDGFDPEKYAAMDTRSGAGTADDDKPISLNTTETKYVSYFARIKHQIERVWIYPVEAAQRGVSGELTLRFQISRDGNLVGLNLVDKSGSEILDYAAIKAVKGAAPFYPIPSTINRDQLTILATFIYSPSYSSPNH